MRRTIRRRTQAGITVGLLILCSSLLLWCLRARTPSLLERSIRLIPFQRVPARSFDYAGRISATEILLLDHGDSQGVAAVVFDTRSRTCHRLDGLSALLRSKIGSGAPADLRVIASPRGDQLIWIYDHAAGMSDLDGQHGQAFEPGLMVRQPGPRDSLDAMWSPDGAMWALVSYGAGVDYAYGDGIAIGSSTSAKPLIVLTPTSPVFKNRLLLPSAMTTTGTIVATDGGRGAFLVNPATQTVKSFILTGLEHDADGLDYRVTTDKRLMWSCRLCPVSDAPAIVRWLYDVMHVQDHPMVQLRVNNLDGSDGREVGRFEWPGAEAGWIHLLGTSPDGRWADFEYDGWLYTTRIQ